MMSDNPWLVVASISGLLAVGAGAYGAHGLTTEDSFQDAFKAGGQYHMWHSLALLAVALFTEQRRNTRAAKWGHLAGGLFLAGIVLFPAPCTPLASAASCSCPARRRSVAWR